MNSQCSLNSSSKSYVPVSRGRLYLAPILALGMMLMACHLAHAQCSPAPPAFPTSLELWSGAVYPFADGQGPVTLTGDGYGNYSGEYTGSHTYSYTTQYWDPTIADWEWVDMSYWDYNSGYYDEDFNWIITPVWMESGMYEYVTTGGWVTEEHTETEDLTFYVDVTIDQYGVLDYSAYADTTHPPAPEYEYSTTGGSVDPLSGYIYFDPNLSGWISPN